MKKMMNLFVACAVLGHSLDCHAIGVVTPTTAGSIRSGNNVQSSGVSINANAVKVEWLDGSGLVKRTGFPTPGAAMPFEWHQDFNLANPLPAITAWVTGTGRCRMYTGSVAAGWTLNGSQTTPPIIP